MRRVRTLARWPPGPTPTDAFRRFDLGPEVSPIRLPLMRFVIWCGVLAVVTIVGRVGLGQESRPAATSRPTQASGDAKTLVFRPDPADKESTALISYAR